MSKLKVTRPFDRADIEEVNGRHYAEGEYEIIAGAPMGKAGLVSQATADKAVEEGWGEITGQKKPRARKPSGGESNPKGAAKGKQLNDDAGADDGNE